MSRPVLELRPHAVYVMWADDVAVYVGISIRALLPTHNRQGFGYRRRAS